MCRQAKIEKDLSLKEKKESLISKYTGAKLVYGFFSVKRIKFSYIICLFLIRYCKQKFSLLLM